MSDEPGRVAFDQELASRLGSFIKRAEQALMAEKARVLRRYDLTVAQYSALMLLLYVPEASAAQLSRACLVTPQTIATILSNLERKGLISREPSAMHQRVLSIRLTAAGSTIAGKADRAAKDVEQYLTAQFSAGDAQQLKDLLDRAVTALHARTSPENASSHPPPTRTPEPR